MLKFTERFVRIIVTGKAKHMTDRHEEIQKSYRQLGSSGSLYDGIITRSTLIGKIIDSLIWGLDKKKAAKWINDALSPLPEADMMNNARKRADAMGISNVAFVQGDVGRLPFADESFDVVLSLNGFHAFPDKDAAYSETHRVLKKGGTFCGCFYIAGEFSRTDWFVEKMYVPKGFFTPPFETGESLEKRLKGMYEKAEVHSANSEGIFCCIK